jgi:hypothetical protein
LPAFALFMRSIDSYSKRVGGDPDPALRSVKVAVLLYVGGAYVIGAYLVFATGISPVLKAGAVLFGVGLGFLAAALRRVG